MADEEYVVKYKDSTGAVFREGVKSIEKGVKLLEGKKEDITYGKIMDATGKTLFDLHADPEKDKKERSDG